MRKKDSLLYFSLLITLILSITQLHSEVRALWVMPWNMTCEKQIDELVLDAYENNQTEILAEVRYRADAMYIPNKANSTFVNPDPQSHLVKTIDFDPLQYLLDKSHEYGIQVQAWIVVLNSIQASTEMAKLNHVYKNHKDWIMTDALGNRMNANKYMGYFIDPGIPEVKNYLLNVILDIVSNYPSLDGIHLDYIRYPAQQLGYSRTSLSRFEEYKKQKNIEWNDWRILQLKEFIQELRDIALVINPDIIITAAVIADAQEAKIHYAQDWLDWVNNGLLDRVYPMAYAKEYNNFYRIVSYYKNKVPEDKVVIGLRAWQESPRQYYDVSRIIEKANLTRELGFGGIALFSYEGVKKSGFFPRLLSSLYSEKALSSIENTEDQFISMITQSYQSKADSTSNNVEILGSFCSNDNDLVDNENTNNKQSYCSAVLQQDNYFKIAFILEQTSLWKWKVYDNKDNIVYTREKLYMSGLNIEEWDGLIGEDRRITPGIYTLKLYSNNNVLIHDKKFIIN